MEQDSVHMVGGGGAVEVTIPGGTRVTGAGVDHGISGESVLDSLLKDVPSIEVSKPKEGKGEEVGKPERWSAPPMSKEAGYDQVPKTLKDTDRLRHENDILFVTNYAMERGGVRSLTEFAEWMHRQMMHASSSGFEDQAGPAAPRLPEVEMLAKYLRQIQHYANRF